MLCVFETKLLRLVTALRRRLPCWAGATGYSMCGVDFPHWGESHRLGHSCPPLVGVTGYAVCG